MSGSLGVRIFAGLALVILLTLGVAGLVFFSLLGGYRRAIDQSTLVKLTDQVLFGVSQFAERNVTPRELARYLEVQSQETGVLVFILDTNGRVLRDLSPGAEFVELGLPVTLADVRRDPDHVVEGEFDAGSGLIPFTARLIPLNRFGKAAFVAMALPGPGASTVAADLVPRLLVSGLAGLGVALVVGLLVSRSIYRPLRRMTAAVRAVGRGRYDTRVPEEGPEETRALAAAFNRMMAQVQSNQRTLQDFMADVGHELRTPLTSIRGFTQALSDGTVQDETHRDRSVAVIDDEARRMLRLVEDLLDLSRMQAGELPLRQEPLDPAELILHVADLFAQRAVDGGVTLETEGLTALPPFRGDYDRLVQVLSNLVDNALQHTHDGHVTLRAQAQRPWLVLQIEDTGEGIPPSDLPALFDRFYRGERAGRRPGSGLGLAISREIVRAHGGEIVAESERGVGTRFHITLPLAEGGSAAPALGR